MIWEEIYQTGQEIDNCKEKMGILRELVFKNIVLSSNCQLEKATYLIIFDWYHHSFWFLLKIGKFWFQQKCGNNISHVNRNPDTFCDICLSNVTLVFSIKCQNIRKNDNWIASILVIEVGIWILIPREGKATIWGGGDDNMFCNAYVNLINRPLFLWDTIHWFYFMSSIKKTWEW